MTAHIAALHRYPVKGLSPEPLDGAALTADAYFPGDRLYAIENGTSGFDPTAPAHQPKIKFLMLMRNERLATLATRYDDATGTLVIHEGASEVLRADLSTTPGRSAVAAFFQRFMPEELRGAPAVLAAPDGFRFTDSRNGFVSILNLASVAALEEILGVPVDPLRFRANIHVAGWSAWHELDLVGQELALGDDVRMTVTKRIVRCAATNVDPATGARDLAIPQTIERHFGHIDCGIYARVTTGGKIIPGDAISPG